MLGRNKWNRRIKRIIRTKLEEKRQKVNTMKETRQIKS